MFIKFKSYGTNQHPPYVNSERVMSFSLISYNGFHGTELALDDGSIIRVGEWPEEVSKKLNQAAKGGE